MKLQKIICLLLVLPLLFSTLLGVNYSRVYAVSNSNNITAPQRESNITNGERQNVSLQTDASQDYIAALSPHADGSLRIMDNGDDEYYQVELADDLNGNEVIDDSELHGIDWITSNLKTMLGHAEPWSLKELSYVGALRHKSYSQSDDKYYIPSSIELFTTLNTLIDTSYGSLSATIPPEIGNCANLADLEISGGSILGGIPPEVGNLSKLQTLYLYNDGNLGGSIPPELGKCSSLKTLELNVIGLKGSIPPELGKLMNLTILRLMTCDFSGSRIPSELGNLTNLQELNLWNDSLAGEIPASIGDLTNVQDLILESNKLSGSIPSFLGKLSKLQYLNLSFNKFTGKIPPELGDLKNLINLDIFYNDLTGGVPSELNGCTSLTELRLDQNENFGGYLPDLSGCTKLKTLGLADDGFIGTVPDAYKNMQSLSYLDISANYLTGDDVANGHITQLYDKDNFFSTASATNQGHLNNFYEVTLNVGKYYSLNKFQLGNCTAETIKPYYYLPSTVPTKITVNPTGALSYDPDTKLVKANTAGNITVTYEIVGNSGEATNANAIQTIEINAVSIPNTLSIEYLTENEDSTFSSFSDGAYDVDQMVFSSGAAYTINLPFAEKMTTSLFLAVNIDPNGQEQYDVWTYEDDLTPEPGDSWVIEPKDGDTYIYIVYSKDDNGDHFPDDAQSLVESNSIFVASPYDTESSNFAETPYIRLTTEDESKGGYIEVKAPHDDICQINKNDYILAIVDFNSVYRNGESTSDQAINTDDMSNSDDIGHNGLYIYNTETKSVNYPKKIELIADTNLCLYFYAEDYNHDNIPDIFEKQLEVGCYNIDGDKISWDGSSSALYLPGDVINVEPPVLDNFIYSNTETQNITETSNGYEVGNDDGYIHFIYDDANTTVTYNLVDSQGKSIYLNGQSRYVKVYSKNSTIQLDDAPEVEGYKSLFKAIEGKMYKDKDYDLGVTPVTVTFVYISTDISADVTFKCTDEDGQIVPGTSQNTESEAIGSTIPLNPEPTIGSYDYLYTTIDGEKTSQASLIVIKNQMEVDFVYHKKDDSGGGKNGRGSRHRGSTTGGSTNGGSTNGNKNVPNEEITILDQNIYKPYIIGYNDGTFRPNNSIKRVEVCQMLYEIEGKPSYDVSTKFPDVDKNAWYYDAVNYFLSKGIAIGYPDGTFKPNEPTTRGEMATLMTKYMGVNPIEGPSNFTDVSEGAWDTSYINAATAQRWYVGYGDGTFKPENNITRAETVSSLNQMLGRIVPESEMTDATLNYTDISTEDWAYYKIILASQKYKVTTNSDGTEKFEEL